MSADKLGEVRFPVTASFIAGAIVVGLGIAFWFATKSFKDLVLFTAASGAAVGAILGAVYAARGIAANVAGLQREEARCAKALAFQFTSKWNDPAMYHVRDAVRGLFNQDHRQQEFMNHIRDQETNIIHFLNFLEEVAIAIDQGGADPKILKEAFAGVVITAWNKLPAWIQEQRQVRGRPRIWIKVEELARSWAV